MIEIENFTDTFVDAAVADLQGNLIFASVWARTAHINALYGKIINQEISFLEINNKKYFVNKQLGKTHARLPKENYYGNDLCHSFIFAEQAKESKGGQRFLINGKTIDSNSIWNAVCDLSDLGLLEQWKDVILQKLKTEGLLITLEQTYNINAVLINFLDREEFEKIISNLIKSETITA